MKYGKKRLVALATSAIICFSTATAIYAAPTTKTLKAIFNGIKISYNGQIKTDEKEPFIVDDTTYVPIRMVGELVGKTVTWDGVNKQIIITDNASSSPDQSQQISSLTSQLALRTREVAQLKEEKTALEEQIAALQNKNNKSNVATDLDELEEQLIEDYEEYEDIEFDIQLSGDEDEIDLKIRVDLDDFDREWDDLSERDIEDYIEDICADIWDVYDDADIEGYIYDTDSREYLVEFESDKRQRLKFEFIESADIADLEYELDRYYRNYFSDIRLSVEVDGDEDDVVYNVRVDYSVYDTEWEALTDTQIINFMSSIYDDVEDALPDAEIEGYVYTSSNKTKLAQYWRSSSGSDRFDRYEY